ncbi:MULTISPECIES: MarR family winged helix-turn-helix transcriptional regulator [Emticicia]|uniref:MarR family winged helix-turn-helix transcriptional regulator n=1 Tax=Emticicia TaxID=312278 RepID=UPI0007D8AE04|nr:MULTISPECIES: MarR family transcriptional regulator [Emticicia]
MTHSDKRSYYFKIDTTIKRIRSFMQKGLTDGGIDLTVDQWVVIDHIKPKAGISQNDLAVDTAKDAPTITRILDLLVEKGLVRRQMADEDRRKFNIYLTEEGENLHQSALSVIGEIRRKSWGSLTDEDYDHLVRIMDTIHKNVSDK